MQVKDASSDIPKTPNVSLQLSFQGCSAAQPHLDVNGQEEGEGEVGTSGGDTQPSDPGTFDAAHPAKQTH